MVLIHMQLPEMDYQESSQTYEILYEKEREEIQLKKNSKGIVLLTCIKNKADKMKRFLKKHKINECFKPHCTLPQMLVRPKDKTHKNEICGQI